MEDAATAEISRGQVWQWIHQDCRIEDGTAITVSYVEELIDRVLGEVERRPGDRFDAAVEISREVALQETFPAFLTLPAYARYLVFGTRVAIVRGVRRRRRADRVEQSDGERGQRRRPPGEVDPVEVREGAETPRPLPPHSR